MKLRWLLAFVWACSPAVSDPEEPVVIEVGKPGAAPAEESFTEAPAVEDNGCIEKLLAGEPLMKDPHGPDQELYVAALAHAQQGNLAMARKTLLELVENHKASPWVPLAYLQFGEMFAREADADPAKLPITVNFYQEALKYPPPGNPGYFYAFHRLGLALARQGEDALAMDAFRSVLRGRLDHPGVGCVGQVAADTRLPMVTAYARVGDPHKAFAFFKALTNMDGSSENTTLLWLVDLADAYMANDQTAARWLTEEIGKRAASPQVCSPLRALFVKHPALRLQVMPFCTP